jgi:shikimate dehydrogenase
LTAATPDRRHAAVLGDPVAHSLSPLLHTAAYAALGLPWRYHAIGCGRDDLAALLGRVRRSGRWAGLSLTMPLKTVAPPLLDEVVGADPAAVNTVVVAGDRLVGHSTDPAGIRAGLDALGYPGGPIAVLGAGGTARAVLVAVPPGTPVTLHVRAPGRAAGAAALGERLGLVVTVAALDAVGPGPVVSTLPATAPAVRVAGPLLDVVYAPWPTPTAAAAPGPVVNGLEVLLGQAAAQVLLLTGRPAPLAAMRAALPVT